MGCDIHIVLEAKFDGQPDWVGLWCSDNLPGGRPIVARRNYEFFSSVAGVRGYDGSSAERKNLPIDISRLAWLKFMAAPTDHHTASLMAVGEFCDRWVRCNPSDERVRGEHALWDLLAIDSDWPKADYRVVFWFAN